LSSHDNSFDFDTIMADYWTNIDFLPTPAMEFQDHQQQQIQNEPKMCCVSFHLSDQIRLTALPPHLIPIIRAAILHGWEPGIASERDYFGTYEFKLKGDPWWGQGEHSVISRQLITLLLIVMAQNGWNLICERDLGKTQGEKDTLVFEQGIPDPTPEVFSVSFNWGDRMQVIDAPAFNPYTKHLVGNNLRQRILVERMVPMQVIVNMKALGFKLYGTIGVKTGGRTGDDAGMDLDSWFFRRVGPAWQ
jgi:hypothetical protein